MCNFYNPRFFVHKKYKQLLLTKSYDYIDRGIVTDEYNKRRVVFDRKFSEYDIKEWKEITERQIDKIFYKRVK